MNPLLYRVSRHEEYCDGCLGSCCTVMQVVEINKPAGQRCEHLNKDGLCSIYENRPMSCQKFDCKGFGPVRDALEKQQLINIQSRSSSVG